MKNKRGVAGLKTFMSIVIFLFLIGLVVFVFIISTNSMKNATASSVSGNITGESILFSTTCQDTSVAGLNGVQLSNVVIRDNESNIIPAEEYTINGGCISANG